VASGLEDAGKVFLRFAILSLARIKSRRSGHGPSILLVTNSAGEFLMMPNQAERIWLVPQKFWSATKQMSAEEIENLIERLMRLSVARDFDSLQQFDFIVVGDSLLHSNAA
jgi:hypothetical protein